MKEDLRKQSIAVSEYVDNRRMRYERNFRWQKTCNGNVLLSGALAGKPLERGSAENA